MNMRSEDIPFSLRVESGELHVSVAGKELGAYKLDKAPLGIALFTSGTPRDSVRISNLTIQYGRTE